MTLGERIQALRKTAGLSQEALGERLGVSRQAISKWEGDLTVPELEKLVALSKLFQVSLGALLGVEEPEVAPPPPAPSGEGRRTRALFALCAVLFLTTALSLGRLVFLEQQLARLQTPPQPPLSPVTRVEYALHPDYQGRTVDLALELEGEELKSWDCTLVAATYRVLEDSLFIEPLQTREAELRWKDGTARAVLEDLPISYALDPKLTVTISYEKDGAAGAQTVLSAAPEHWGGDFQVIPQEMPAVEAVEAPELLEEP